MPPAFCTTGSTMTAATSGTLNRRRQGRLRLFSLVAFRVMFGAANGSKGLMEEFGNLDAAAAFGPFRGDEARVSDRDIRRALARANGPLSGWAAECVIEEVRCWRGYARADYLLASPDFLSVVEIKSDRDSLRRLDEQIRVYSAVADRVILVVGWMLAAEALRTVPWWWDVWLAEKPPQGETQLVRIRDGANNPDVEPFALASMLPVHEARRVAINAGLTEQRSRGERLRELLSRELTRAELRIAVHEWLLRLSDQRISSKVLPDES